MVGIASSDKLIKQTSKKATCAVWLTAIVTSRRENGLTHLGYVVDIGKEFEHGTQTHADRQY
jgi:hypothetical protein